MLFLKSQQKTDVILKKSDVTHVPGKKRLSASQTDGHQGFGPGMPKKIFFFFFILLFKKTIFIFCDYFLIYKRFAMNWNWWKINWLYQLFHKSLKNAQKTQNSPKGLHSVFCQKQIFFSLLRVSEHRFWKLLKNCIECISQILDRTIP